MKLYGTTTSPFVRRVRVVCAEVGEPVELVDTATEAGQAALRAVTPIWKVPVAELDGQIRFDSRVIIDHLLVHRGFGGLTPPQDPWAEANLLSAIDAALDSAISVFYLRREGVAIDDTAFAQRQRARIESILEWLATRLPERDVDLATISLVCALDWMDFRATYPTERHPRLAPLRAALREHPSLAATRPHA
ncbi:MAG: glutathione S-transferase family protein [Kofleriaceae bacterium]